jgi:LPXTG-site transpeptidase (sortase) family protein
MTKQPPIDKRELLSVYRQALLHNVPLKSLEKKVVELSQRTTANQNFETELDQKITASFWSRIPNFMRVGATFMPLVFILVGIFLAGSAAWPIISQLFPDPVQDRTSLLSPLSNTQLSQSRNLVFAKANVIDENEPALKTVLDEPIMLDYNLDYLNLSNWFADDASLGELEYEIEEYRLDIPGVEISNAKVRVGGTDLNKSLIQYPGTALPGEPGAPVIFGHSVLRQFYNPSEKNPRRYSSIFSKIMTLKPGDKIYLTHKNVKYTYEVQSNTEVQPTDTFILAQRYDARQLKLVTCVPEGTVLRRGIVIAQLVKE